MQTDEDMHAGVRRHHLLRAATEERTGNRSSPGHGPISSLARHSATWVAISSWRWVTTPESRVAIRVEDYAGQQLGQERGRPSGPAPVIVPTRDLRVLDQLAEVHLQSIDLAVLLEPLLGLCGAQHRDPLT